MDQQLVSEIAAEASRIEEDALYSGRGHFDAAAAWSRAHYRLGIPTSVLAAIAGGSAIADNLTAAAIVGLIVTALSALSTFLNPSDRAHRHHTAGALFNEVRNQARVLRKIDLKTTSHEEPLIERLRALGTERDKLNKTSPQIPRWAFKRARKSIEAGEASYAVDSRSGDQQLPGS